MTTLREEIERTGKLSLQSRTFWKRNKGKTPLCCFEMRKNSVRCAWTKKWLPMDEFHFVCLGCQKEIEGKL